MGREAYLAGCVAADAADEEDDVRGDGRSEASGPERRRLVRTDDKAEQRGKVGGCSPTHARHPASAPRIASAACACLHSAQKLVLLGPKIVILPKTKYFLDFFIYYRLIYFVM
jgi:hypothetical protein